MVMFIQMQNFLSRHGVIVDVNLHAPYFNVTINIKITPIGLKNEYNFKNQ